MKDIRQALRLFTKNRGFAATVILVLVAGVLVNTAAFGIVNAVWFRPLPIRSAERVLILGETNTRTGGREPVSYPEFLDLQRQTALFSGVAAFLERQMNIGGEGSFDAQRVTGGAISANAMDVLGIRPLKGRNFSSAEESAAAPVALIGETLWRSRFAADPEIAGRTVRIDGRAMTVLGVFPLDFRFVYAGYDVLVPLAPEVRRATRADRSLDLLARVADGVTVEQARSALAGVSANWARDYPASKGWTLQAEGYLDAFRQRHAQYGALLVGAGLVLALVCANLSGLFVARNASRQKEIAIRMALGAGRMTIVRLMLVESMLLALVSAALACGGALWLRRIVVATVPELAVFEIDYRVLGYTLFVCVVAGLWFGLAPAIAVSRVFPAAVLKTHARSCSVGGQRMRSALVVAQLAIGIMLLAGAGMLARAVGGLRSANTGLRTEGLLMFDISLTGDRYAKPEARDRFWASLAERVGASAGVTGAALYSSRPLAGGPIEERVEVEGQPALEDATLIASSAADARYFDLVGIGLLAGRRLTPGDRRDGQPVAFVNTAFVKRFWGNDAPPDRAVGKRIRLGKSGEWLTVAGVTPDARQVLNQPPYPEVLRPVAQTGRTAMCLIVRSGLSEAAVAGAVRGSVRNLDNDLPVTGPATIEGVIENYYPSALVIGLGIFAAVATLLAALGLYSVVSFLALRRAQEIGIRMALGANSWSVVRLVAGHSLRLASLGAALGIAGAIAVGRLLERFVEGATAADPSLYATVAAVLCAVALTAAAAPSWRAARLDPATAIRQD